MLTLKYIPIFLLGLLIFSTNLQATGKYHPPKNYKTSFSTKNEADIKDSTLYGKVIKFIDILGKVIPGMEFKLVENIKIADIINFNTFVYINAPTTLTKDIPENKKPSLIYRELVIWTIFKEKVFFDSGNHDIDKTAAHVIQNLVKEVYAQSPKYKYILAMGHTDNVGKPLPNDKLSKDRADSVCKHLEMGMKSFVSKDQKANFEIKGQGFGEKHPHTPSPEGTEESTNRRVEFLYTTAKDQQAAQNAITNAKNYIRCLYLHRENEPFCRQKHLRIQP